jgi:CHAT domain-containing protein
LGEAATETAIRRQASLAGILHLAAHGEYNLDNALYSTLYLAPDQTLSVQGDTLGVPAGAGASLGDNLGNSTDKPGSLGDTLGNQPDPLKPEDSQRIAPERDGRLEAHEVYSLDLDRAELVVLSACQTQLGQLSAGDELVGLTRAFMFAGAPTVVASLWNVDDAATALLMERFYSHLKAGLGKSAALRQAQLDLIQEAAYSEPYYWAGFVLSGDGGQVSPIAALPSIQAEDAPSSPTPTAQPAGSTQSLIGGGLFIAGGLLLGLASLLAIAAMVWLRWRHL